MSYSNPMHHETPLPRPYAAAYKKLAEMGVPVYRHPDDCGNFSIDAEAPEADTWVDYYGNPYRQDLIFGVHIDVAQALEKHGLFAEWVNPGRLAVYK